MWQYILSFISAALLAYFLTPLVRWLALRVKAVDQPDERKLHLTPTPRLGGLAISASFVVILGLALFYQSLTHHQTLVRSLELRALFISIALITALGIYDDIRGASYKLKFFVQILVAVIMIYFGCEIQGVTNPITGYTIPLKQWEIPLTILWFVGVTNAMNLIDGVDGLASGVSLVALSTIFLISLYLGLYHVAIIAVILSGAVAGFLRYNFYPASIFMGDTGSLFLGFMLAYLSLKGVQKSTTAVAIATPILILGFPILDTIAAFVRRLIRRDLSIGEAKDKVFNLARTFAADKRHIHHRLLQKGFTERQTAIILYMACLCMGLCAFLLTAAKNRYVALVLLYVIGLLFLAVRKLRVLEMSPLSGALMPQANETQLKTFIRNRGNHANARRILWIEKSGETKEAAEEFLKNLPHPVTHVQNYAEAMEEFNRHFYPVVVADVEIEGENGIELFKRLKMRNEHLIFILLADRRQFEQALEAVELGIDDVVGKPVNPKKFKLVFSKAVEKLELYSSKRFLKSVVWGLIALIPLVFVLSGFLGKLLRMAKVF